MRFESLSDSKNKLCHGPLLQCPCHRANESCKFLMFSNLQLTIQREEVVPGFACGKMPSRFWNNFLPVIPSEVEESRSQGLKVTSSGSLGSRSR
jgi:hypothetical protein